MFSVRRTAILALVCWLTLSSCGGKSTSGSPSGSAGGAKDLNLYIWSDYLAPNTLPDFEKQTGIKVHAAYFDTNETLETKLLAGSSGFDVVVPSASYFERQIKAGAYRDLDKAKLPNLKNMDPQLMAKVALHDPDNRHGVIYLWGTNGIGYNEKMIKALMPDGVWYSTLQSPRKWRSAASACWTRLPKCCAPFTTIWERIRIRRARMIWHRRRRY